MTSISNPVCRHAVVLLGGLSTLVGCIDKSAEESAALVLTADNAEVVVAADAPRAVRFAGQEATNFLSRVLGGDIPLVAAPTPGKGSVILGSNEWNERAGVTTSGLSRDAFRLKTDGACLRIVGRDSEQGGWSVASGGALNPAGFANIGEHATAFGVYEFLHRYAGVRLYFPGELGEVVPRRNVIRVPCVDETVAPDFRVRKVYMSADGPVYDENEPGHTREGRKALNWMRLRLETEYVPCCHGQCRNMFLDRFGKTHPEYFALLKGPDGKLHRDSEPCMRKAHNTPKYYYLCQTSKAWDEMYEDALSYLKGEPASTRKVLGEWDPQGRYAWGGNMGSRKYVDVMCEDGYEPCLCEKCQKAYDFTRKNYATELVWGQTVRLANRLKAAGVDGYVTQMAYAPYHDIPKVDFPDNLLVMVAQLGPWGAADPDRQARDAAEVVAWAKKCGGKVWLWNYIVKYAGFDIKGVPCMTPRAIGAYYPKFAPHVFGAFAESGCDKALYQYLNYYVFSRVCWNLKEDVGALLDEHYRGMFGPAAGEMKTFFEDLEDRWINRVGGKTMETNLGPVTVAPGPAELWGDVYSVETCERWAKLFDRAVAKVAVGSLEARRLALFRREFLDPIREKAEAVSVPAEQRRRAARMPVNVLLNGSFDSLEGWYQYAGPQMSLDRENFVSPPSSVRVTSTNHFSVCQSVLGKMVPGRRYRVSYFMKTGDMEPCTRSPGIFAEFFCGSKCQFFPRTKAGYAKSDWVHRSEEFTYGPLPEGEKNDRPFFRFFIQGFKGTVWFDDVLVEEIGAEAK